MAPAAIPLMLAGTGLSAFGQIRAGQQAAAEGEASQEMAEYNAMLMEREARAIESKSRFERGRQAEEADRLQSSLLASMGGAGVVPAEGTALEILGEQAGESELENRLAGWNYATEAQRARQRGQAYLREGSLARQRGKARRVGAFTGAGTTLLTGFSRARRKA